jgi:hypothetical protein
MDNYLTSSTFISRWLENFESYEVPSDFEFYDLITFEEYSKLNISQKIKFLSINDIAYIDEDENGVIPNSVNPKLEDIICREVFNYISLDYSFKGYNYKSKIESLLEGLDEENRLKIINKKIKKENKKNSKNNEYLFSEGIYYGHFFDEQNLQTFHTSFWNGLIPFNLKYKLIKSYILSYEEMWGGGFNEKTNEFEGYIPELDIEIILNKSWYYRIYSIFIDCLLRQEYLKKVKILVQEGKYKSDIDCNLEDEEYGNNKYSNFDWYENVAPHIFINEYSINLLIFILTYNEMDKTPSFYSYLYHFFNKFLNGRHKGLLISEKPGFYMEFVNHHFNAGLKGKILNGTSKKREEYFLIFNENEKIFVENVSSARSTTTD